MHKHLSSYTPSIVMFNVEEFYKKLESGWCLLWITSTNQVSHTAWPYTKNGAWLKNIVKRISQ